jgi:NAD(P)-dependent dehydrogenase (short-subunit alcohol dehydrogenase family)
VTAMTRFQGMTVVITGAGAGMGRAAALRFAHEGADLALCDIDKPALDETVRLVASQSASAVLACRTDISVIEDLENFARQAIEKFEVLDVIYNNAGVVLKQSIEETAVEDWDRLHAINVRAAAFLVKFALPALRLSKNPSVINVSSGAAVQAAIEGNTAYCSSKGAILALTRAQARDLAADGIRVNCVLPGAIETDLVTNHLASMPDDEAAVERSGFVSRTLFKRFGRPDEVAAVAAFLASADASYINAASLHVDNGWTAI